jgi:hypothetical protein
MCGAKSKDYSDRRTPILNNVPSTKFSLLGQENASSLQKSNETSDKSGVAYDCILLSQEREFSRRYVV